MNKNVGNKKMSEGKLSVKNEIRENKLQLRKTHMEKICEKNDKTNFLEKIFRGKLHEKYIDEQFYLQKNYPR